jgi:hypothetical protein
MVCFQRKANSWSSGSLGLAIREGVFAAEDKPTSAVGTAVGIMAEKLHDLHKVATEWTAELGCVKEVEGPLDAWVRDTIESQGLLSSVPSLFLYEVVSSVNPETEYKNAIKRIEDNILARIHPYKLIVPDTVVRPAWYGSWR